MLKDEKIDIGAFIESGVYNEKKPFLPLTMTK